MHAFNAMALHCDLKYEGQTRDVMLVTIGSQCRTETELSMTGIQHIEIANAVDPEGFACMFSLESRSGEETCEGRKLRVKPHAITESPR